MGCPPPPQSHPTIPQYTQDLGICRKNNKLLIFFFAAVTKRTQNCNDTAAREFQACAGSRTCCPRLTDAIQDSQPLARVYLLGRCRWCPGMPGADAAIARAAEAAQRSVIAGGAVVAQGAGPVAGLVVAVAHAAGGLRRGGAARHVRLSWPACIQGCVRRLRP